MTAEVGFTEAAWPPMRNAVETVLRQHRPHTTYGLSEADVTDALAAISELRRQVRVAVSFHAYALYCLALTTAEHPDVLTYRRGNRLVTFRDADIATMIEKRFPGGLRLPAGHTVRAAQTKSLATINWELRQAVRKDQSHTEEVRGRRRMARMPAPVRRFIGWRMGRDPFLLRRYHGTIGLTNLQTPGFHSPLFALPINICTLTLALGTISPRAVLDADGRPMTRQVISMAAGVDHLVVDGMGMSRFAQHMVKTLESAVGLDESFVTETRELMRERSG